MNKGKVAQRHTVVILGAGPSLTQEIVDKVSPYFDIITVNNSVFLNPDCIALVAQDKGWWENFRDDVINCGFNAEVYSSTKKAKHPFKKRVVGASVRGEILAGSTARTPNSGALAVYIAACCLGYTRIVMLGFDMRGSHFFGDYSKESGLRNVATTESRYKSMFVEFDNTARFIKLQRPQVEIINCTDNSAIDSFEKVPLDELIGSYRTLRRKDEQVYYSGKRAVC